MKEMRIGISLDDPGDLPGGVEALLERVRRAERLGIESVWFPNIFAFDAMTLAALAGRVTERVALGTAVVPTFSRHPVYMAQQALSTQAATGGRFRLGIGPSHQIVIESMLGLSYARPARHVREYLQVLKPLIDRGNVAFEGELYRVRARLQVSGARPCPVLIAGLGPRMRRLAGALADGTITWMVGPRTLEQQIAPDVRAAAREAGRPEPQIVVGAPLSVTDDVEGARAQAARQFAVYGQLPSYRAMLEAEGVDGPAALAIVGDENEVMRRLERLREAGATEFDAWVFGHGDDPKAAIERSLAFLGGLARA